MAQPGPSLSRGILFARCLAFAVLTAGTFLLSPVVAALTPSYSEIEGYITVVRPDSFYVSETRIAITRGTQYQFMGDHAPSAADPKSKSIMVGAYVKVTGDVDRPGGITTAAVILFRDETVRKLSGLGVIDRVVSAGAEPVYQADGYRIRITAATKTSFTGDLKTLQDVGPNSWIHYVGIRGRDGVLVASKAQFIPAKPTAFKALKGLEVRDVKFELPPSSPPSGASNSKGQSANDVLDQEAALPEDGGRVLLGSTWHNISTDRALQSRVRRIGARLVPAYQKRFPADHSSKIHFRFYAVDAQKIRSESCALDGLIFVPVQVIERLKNDDQLAAVLADGIGTNLQRQAARLVADERKLLGNAIAGDIAGALVPGLGLVAVPGAIAGQDIETEMEEQRGRVALSLMADAGYDPRQAPEAWRLLAPKKLPSNPDTLTYPSISGYQLSILKLQYTMADNAATERSK